MIFHTGKVYGKLCINFRFYLNRIYLTTTFMKSYVPFCLYLAKNLLNQNIISINSYKEKISAPSHNFRDNYRQGILWVYFRTFMLSSQPWPPEKTIFKKKIIKLAFHIVIQIITSGVFLSLLSLHKIRPVKYKLAKVSRMLFEQYLCWILKLLLWVARETAVNIQK
jgi:hypothetical protein